MRASIGLSALKPSEMVAGLDQAAARAEKLEQRENERRKAGGMAAMNSAVRVDETGKRWSRQIAIGLAASGAVALVVVALMVWSANHKDAKPREAREVTRQRLETLRLLAAQMKPFAKDEDASLESVKARLLEKIASELKLTSDQLDRLKEDRRPIDSALLRQKQELAELLELKDGWGEPLGLSLPDPESLRISVAGGKSGAPEPLTVKIPRMKK